MFKWILRYNYMMRWRKIKQNKSIKPNDKVQVIIYARYADKIKALIVDLFMIYMPILYVIAYVILGGKKAFLASTVAHFAGVAVYGIIYAIFLAKTGQTPGKRAYNLKVVDSKTFKKISFVRSIFRFIAFLFTGATILGIFLPFYKKDNSALHDIICHTVEIESKTLN